MPPVHQNPYPPEPRFLTDAHRHELEVGSGIHPVIIAERGYSSVTAEKVESLDIFGHYQYKSGLIIPIETVHGQVGSFQLKPDQPRIAHNGKPIKYETIPDAEICIDVPNRVLPFLDDPGTTLWITEGAKKVDAGLSHGIEAIVGLQGVYGWRGKNSKGGKTALADWEKIALNGRDVVIAFDSDCMTKPQVRGALERLAAFLKSRGAEIGYCLMPDLPDGGKCGLDDFFVQGKTYQDLCDCIVEELPPLNDPNAPDAAARPELLMLSDVAPERMAWLWEGWIPRRMLTIMGGYGGDGKSTVMASLIGALTTGGTLPDGTRAPQTNVLMLSAEDDAAVAIRPRLDVHGADPSRVALLKGTRLGDGSARWLDLRRDVDIMRAVITHHEIGLVVIDPLSSYLPHADRNSEGDIRDALQPLLGLMEETGVGVVGIMHVGKSSDGRRASQRLLGSTAFTALARSVLMVADVPDDQQPEDTATQGKQKVLQVVKSNYAIAPPPRLFQRPLNAPIRWHGESAVTIDDCFAGAAAKKGPDGQDRVEAVELLREALMNGPVPATEITEMARATGISERTLRRAKKTLGIRMAKSGYQGTWHWHLPVPPVSVKGGHVPL